MNVKKIVDVRELNPAERQRKVKEESMGLKKEEIMEVVSDDPRMLQLASKIVKALGGLELIEVRKEEDSLFHAYIRKI